MTRTELFRHFDRIRDALLAQEKKRNLPGFGQWVMRALPLFAEHINAVDAAEQRAYGRVLCYWDEWLQERRLSWRGRCQWEIPSDGPLLFTPPSMSGLLARAGEVIHELGLEDAIRRSARFGVAPIEGTRGANGRKRGRGMYVRK